MTSNLVTVGIVVGVLFAGLAGGYVIAEQTFSPRNLMAQDPQATSQWMSTMMGTMMNDPQMRQEMMNDMMNHQDFMDDMMKNNDMMNMMMQNSEMINMMGNSEIMQSWMNTMMSDPEVGQEIMKQMMQNPEMMSGMMGSGMGQGMMGSEMMSGSMMSNMPFNADAPITMPMIDGYYNGEKIFFVHTEVSDEDMADMMSMMINFPTLHVSELNDISQDELAKVYVFTNGISGSGPYGGGPFMYQIDVFDSIPGEMGYSQYRVPQLVTWNENSTPRIMTSVDEILEAETNGELTIQKTDNVVNAPMMVWMSDGKQHRANIVPRMFHSMPDVTGEAINVDVDNYMSMFKLHSKSSMGMMDMTSITMEEQSLYNEVLNPNQIEYPNIVGFNDLHIEAIRHLQPDGDDTKLDVIVHHHCKLYDDMTAACLLFPTGMEDQDKPYGMEYVITSEHFQELSDEEKLSWHYHLTELPRAKAVFPDLTSEELAEVQPVLDETYGKVFYFWDFDEKYPIGEPSILLIQDLPE